MWSGGEVICGGSQKKLQATGVFKAVLTSCLKNVSLAHVTCHSIFQRGGERENLPVMVLWLFFFFSFHSWSYIRLESLIWKAVCTWEIEKLRNNSNLCLCKYCLAFEWIQFFGRFKVLKILKTSTRFYVKDFFFFFKAFGDCWVMALLVFFFFFKPLT